MTPPPCRRWLAGTWYQIHCIQMWQTVRRGWRCCVYFTVVSAPSVVVDTIGVDFEFISVDIAYYTDRYWLIAVYRRPGYTFDYLSFINRLLLCLEFNTSRNIIIAGYLNSASIILTWLTILLHETVYRIKFSTFFPSTYVHSMSLNRLISTICWVLSTLIIVLLFLRFGSVVNVLYNHFHSVQITIAFHCAYRVLMFSTSIFNLRNFSVVTSLFN